MTGLVAIIHKRWDDLEADFTRFYNTDLRQACWGTGRWSVRRLFTHVKGLPRESAFRRGLEGEQAWWDRNTVLLADLYDRIQLSTYHLLQALGVDRPPDFDPYPRPTTDEEAPVEGASLLELNAWLMEVFSDG